MKYVVGAKCRKNQAIQTEHIRQLKLLAKPIGLGEIKTTDRRPKTKSPFISFDWSSGNRIHRSWIVFGVSLLEAPGDKSVIREFSIWWLYQQSSQLPYTNSLNCVENCILQNLLSVIVSLCVIRPYYRTVEEWSKD